MEAIVARERRCGALKGEWDAILSKVALYVVIRNMRKLLLTRVGSDRKFADELGRLLTKLNFEVWIDISGKHWDFKKLPYVFPEAQEVFDQCELMIVVISPASVQSVKIYNDWQYFLDQGKPVVPVIWRQVDVPEPLRREQYIDFSDGDYKAAFARLRVELKQK